MKSVGWWLFEIFSCQENVNSLSVHHQLSSFPRLKQDLSFPKLTHLSRLPRMMMMMVLWWPRTQCSLLNLELYPWRNQSRVETVAGVQSGFSTSALPSASSSWWCWWSTCSSAPPCLARVAGAARRRKLLIWRTLIRTQDHGKVLSMVQGRSSFTTILLSSSTSRYSVNTRPTTSPPSLASPHPPASSSSDLRSTLHTPPSNIVSRLSFVSHCLTLRFKVTCTKERHL